MISSYGHHCRKLLPNGLYVVIPWPLKKELDVFIDDMLNSEMDLVIVIDGPEGVGKSRNGRVLGAYISLLTGQKFGPDNIHFNVEDYINFSENGKKFHVNVLDESRMALNKRRAMGKSVVKFTNWLSENRDKQQVHIIILPAIHDLDTYITMWRMAMLINTIKYHGKSKTSMSGYELIRGYFKIYENNKDLQRVIFNKARYGHYSYPWDAKIMSKFYNSEVFTTKELKQYMDKKQIKRVEKYKEEEKKVDKGLMKRNEMIIKLKEKGFTIKQIGELSGIKDTMIKNICKKAKEAQATAHNNNIDTMKDKDSIISTLTKDKSIKLSNKTGYGLFGEKVED